MSNDRIEKLQKLLAEAYLDAAIFCKPVNIYYLTGYTSLDSTRPTSYTRPIFAVIDGSGATLVLPELGLEAAKKICWISDLRTYSRSPAYDEAKKTLVERLSETISKHGRFGIEEDYLPVGILKDLVSFFPKARFENAAKLVEKMRIIKSRGEISALTKAAKISDMAIAASLREAFENRSELETQAYGNFEVFKSQFGEASSNIDTISIILGGPRSSMPHEFTSERRFKQGEIMWHCWLTSYNGYWAENVRTGVSGKAVPQQRSIAAVVQEALELGKEEVRPGNQACSVYEKVRHLLKKAGVDRGLILSRSGHGTGLEYHEPPFIETADKTVFEPGMTVTVEPGIFIPGYGGFTLSDTLVVTDKGHEVLTTYPVQLFENAN